MIRVDRIDAPDLLIALSVSLIVQFGFVAVISSPDREMHIAAISDERAQSLAIAVTPMPLLRRGSSVPEALPRAWQRRPPSDALEPPRHAPRAHRDTPQEVPSTPLMGSTRSKLDEPPRDTGAPTFEDPLLSVPRAPMADAATSLGGGSDTPREAGVPEGVQRGSPNGSPEGTETDPLKARAVDLYRAQLSAFFLRRFAIRGKLPFETLRGLRASARVHVSQDRRVEGSSLSASSGNDVFDREVRAALDQCRSVELPPPPSRYPDVLGQEVPVVFLCTQRSLCE